MKHLLLVCSLFLLVSLAKDQLDELKEAFESQEGEVKPKPVKKAKYNISQTGFGFTDEEAYNNYGAIVNEFKSFDKELRTSHKLIFIYVFDSASFTESSLTFKIHNDIIKPTVRELRGMIQFHAFDCEHPTIKNGKSKVKWKFEICRHEQNPTRMPLLTKIVPSDVRNNPYTGKPIAKQTAHFNANGRLNSRELKHWMLDVLPNYSLMIENSAKYDLFVKKERSLNKVLLFTKQGGGNMTAALRGLSATYRDRLRFYVFNYGRQSMMANQNDLVAIKKAYNVTEFPTLLVEQSYDAVSNKDMKDTKVFSYSYSIESYREMKEFLSKYAKSKEQLPTEAMELEKEDQSTGEAMHNVKDFFELNVYNFEKEVLRSHHGCIVYFTTLGPQEDITKEFKYFRQFVRQFMGPLKMAVFRVDVDDPSLTDALKKYKAGNVAPGRPVLRYYPNKVYNDVKLDKSFRLPLHLRSKNFTEIYDHIREGFKSSVEPIAPHMFQEMILFHGQAQGKHVLYYMFQGDDQTSITYKHLSNLQILQDSCAFLAIKDPSTEVFQGLNLDQLPLIGHLPSIKKGVKDTMIKPSNLDANMPYHQILLWVAEKTNKKNEILQMIEQEKNGRTKRNFGVINSNRDFVRKCIAYKKGCAIGMLSGANSTQMEQEEIESQISLLETMDQEAVHLPIFYSWINVTCYPEWMGNFGFDLSQVPTVLFYQPHKDRYSFMIGKFDQETIKFHQSRFLKGTLPSLPVRIKHNKMRIQRKICKEEDLLDLNKDQEGEEEWEEIEFFTENVNKDNDDDDDIDEDKDDSSASDKITSDAPQNGQSKSQTPSKNAKSSKQGKKKKKGKKAKKGKKKKKAKSSGSAEDKDEL